MAQGAVCLANFIQGPLLTMVVGTGVEFCGYNGRQDCALEDPGVFPEPKIVLAPAKSDVNAGIEQKWTGRVKSSLLRWGASKYVVGTSEPSQASQGLKTRFHSQPFVDCSSHGFRIAA